MTQRFEGAPQVRVQARSWIVEPGLRGVAEDGHSDLGREPREAIVDAPSDQRRRQGTDEVRRLRQHPLLRSVTPALAAISAVVVAS